MYNALWRHAEAHGFVAMLGTRRKFLRCAQNTQTSLRIDSIAFSFLPCVIPLASHPLQPHQVFKNPFSITGQNELHVQKWWRFRRLDPSGCQFHQRILAPRRWDPEFKRVQNSRRPFQIRRFVAQSQLWNYVCCGHSHNFHLPHDLQFLPFGRASLSIPSGKLQLRHLKNDLLGRVHRRRNSNSKCFGLLYRNQKVAQKLFLLRCSYW